MIQISNGHLRRVGSHVRVSAQVDGDEVWFQFPDTLSLAVRGEPFLSLAFFLGLSLGQDVTFDGSLPVSGPLLAVLPALQAVLCQWNPDFKRIAITATPREAEAKKSMVLCSFSGGVDSLFTFGRHQREITHLLVMNTFDVKGDGAKATFHDTQARIHSFAEEFDKILVPIETNARIWADARNMEFEYVQGSLLCTIAHWLGSGRYYIASSYTYRELKPWGSHPLLDPLWSADTSVIHDGCDARRTEKTAAIAIRKELLKYLQVCWYSPTRNCGKCSKCLRTMLALQMLGVSDAPFPKVNPVDLLPDLQISSDLSGGFVWDLMYLAKERGDHNLERRLQLKLRRYLIRRNAEGLAKALFGRRGVALYDRLKKPGWRGRKVITLDPDNFQ